MTLPDLDPQTLRYAATVLDAAEKQHGADAKGWDNAGFLAEYQESCAAMRAVGDQAKELRSIASRIEREGAK